MIGKYVVLTAGMQGPPGRDGTTFLSLEQCNDLTGGGNTDSHLHDIYVTPAEGYTLYAPLLGGEPQGFIDRAQLTLSWDDASRTITLTPVGASFQFYSGSVLYTKTAADSLVIANTQGTHYVYYDETGTLAETGTYDASLINDHAIAATIAWNATTGKAVPDALLETHGCEMAADIHLYLHLTQGTKYQSGLAPTVVVDADGSLLLHAQVSATSGIIWDEDIQHAITSRAVTDAIPVIYRTGASGIWDYDQTSSATVRTTGTGRAAYNQWTGATWQLAEVSNNGYVLAHLYAIPGVAKKWMIVMGQNSYVNAPAARAGASAEILGITGLPTPEYKAVGTFLLQTSDSYTNSVKSRLRSIDDGESYVDWRTSSPVGGFPVVAHDSISGIDSGDIQHISLVQKLLIPSGVPSAGQVPVATGQTTSEWTTIKSTSVNTDKTSDTKYPTVKAVYDWVIGYIGFPVNNIGRPNTAGFGQGICPALPSGYTPLAGYTEPLNFNWGTYQYSDGSIMCWVPAFFMRIGHVGNPTYATYGVNSISILSIDSYPSDAAANAAGYYRHRAFINGGANQPGFFRDKYDCSNNGGIASSIANAMPLVSGPAAGQDGFSVLTGTPANASYGAIDAAKTRGTKFFPESAFIADAVTKISQAQAQAATSATYCAWYDAAGIINYPKGNDNNALSCGVDLSVTFTTAGASSYPNFALTGSGTPFAKTTHNGQACGITDVAGNLYKVSLGMTSVIGAAKTITAATQANPVNITAVGHGYTTGLVIDIMGIVGMGVLNNKMYKVTVVDVDNFTLDGVNGTAFAAYTSGGSAYSCQYYALKESVDIATITSGNSAATDHWGTTGIAANFDAITLNFNTTYPNNEYGQRYGNSANAVFDMSTAANRLLTMMGMPATSGMSLTGTNAMGQDHYYIDYVNHLCLATRGSWSVGSIDGVNSKSLLGVRTGSYPGSGFACASYL